MATTDLDLVPVLSRDRAIERLQQMYAHDQISMDDLESRLTRVEGAKTKEELETIFADLVVAQSPSTSLARATPPVQLSAIFGSSERRGDWSVPPVLHVRALFGSVDLDLSAATLPAEVDIHVDATFGSICIRVPAGVRVDVDGQAFLGSFEQRTGRGSGDVRIRIHGRALFGSVEIL